jgi:ribosomal protein L11 methyltransferase
VLRLAVRVRRERAELVLAELLELAPGGVEEIELGDVVEYAVYGPAGELPALPDLRAAAGGALVEVTTSEIADDWADRWRGFHVPLVLDGALTVRPPWEPPGATAIDVVIDPGQAFGTGAHATTRLCLELMLAVAQPDGSGEPPKGPFVDLGCGSGVLAVTAAKLGWAPVAALDNDPASVAAAQANAAVNGVEVDVRRWDLRADPWPAGQGFRAGATVAANLLVPLLVALAARESDVRPGTLIAGGLLAHEADNAAGVFAPRGLRETGRRIRGEWAALLLERPA